MASEPLPAIASAAASGAGAGTDDSSGGPVPASVPASAASRDKTMQTMLRAPRETVEGRGMC